MRGRFAEIEKRAIVVRKNIYHNGEDNLYPNEVDALISNSVTASGCAEKMAAFITGKGFGEDIDDLIINQRKDYTAYDLLTMTAESVSTQKGVFIHVSYDFEGNPEYDVLQYEKCRISKEDDADNKGKIYYSDYGAGVVESRKKEKWFYPYNPDLNVINAQRKRDCELLGIKEPTVEQLLTNYRGQVYFLSLDNKSVYPQSWIHSVMNDCDSEFHISVMRNNQIKNGFQKSTWFFTEEMDQEEGDVIFDTIKKVSSSKNAGNVAMLEFKDFSKDKIHIQQLESDIDDKVVDLTETRLANNIRKAYKNIPKALIDSENGALFGSSGEALKEMIDSYSDELSKERRIIEQVFTMLLKPLLKEPKKIKILPINYDANNNKV